MRWSVLYRAIKVLPESIEGLLQPNEKGNIDIKGAAKNLMLLCAITLFYTVFPSVMMFFGK